MKLRFILPLLALPAVAQSKAVVTYQPQTITAPMSCQPIKITIPKNGGSITITPQCSVTVKIPAQVMPLPKNATIACTGQSPNAKCVVTFQ